MNEIIISTEKIDNVQVIKLQGSINSFTEKNSENNFRFRFVPVR
ncbi:hypothetical protein LEP1GSC151_3545 [Leptospira interrogans serovar Grippotyphosa str. LT2186]|uniref:Uncharacterized protein n=1 Tax=Leptospira interrogans serovar Grippotyphosa str. LT2186 TaxID=1001599 RepID=M3H018_LEPIR|nr:hypothetical protein LEP1GSC151_3545 [Leptospira interrogans serovar Grippotyphosa str. LT2186]